MLGPEEKQEERQVPNMQKALLKRKGKKLLYLSVAIREKIILFVDLNFIREH